MTYIELINEFWKQDRLKSFENVDTKLYFMLLDELNIRKWLNPIELHTYYLEGRLQIKRKAIGEARNRLKQRGLIDYVTKPNNPTVYLIENIETNNPELNQLFPTRNNCETIGKQLGNNCETIGKQYIEDYKDLKTEDIKENPPKGGQKKTLSVAETFAEYHRVAKSENYLKFLEWLSEKAPYVASHIYPLSESEFEKLRAAYGSQSIVQNILNIENRKDLRKKYKSLYRTLINWCKNGYNT